MTNVINAVDIFIRKRNERIDPNCAALFSLADSFLVQCFPDGYGGYLPPRKEVLELVNVSRAIAFRPDGDSEELAFKGSNEIPFMTFVREAPFSFPKNKPGLQTSINQMQMIFNMVHGVSVPLSNKSTLQFKIIYDLFYRLTLKIVEENPETIKLIECTRFSNGSLAFAYVLGDTMLRFTINTLWLKRYLKELEATNGK